MGMALGDGALVENSARRWLRFRQWASRVYAPRRDLSVLQISRSPSGEEVTVELDDHICLHVMGRADQVLDMAEAALAVSLGLPVGTYPCPLNFCSYKASSKLGLRTHLLEVHRVVVGA